MHAYGHAYGLADAHQELDDPGRSGDTSTLDLACTRQISWWKASVYVFFKVPPCPITTDITVRSRDT